MTLGTYYYPYSSRFPRRCSCASSPPPPPPRDPLCELGWETQACRGVGGGFATPPFIKRPCAPRLRPRGRARAWRWKAGTSAQDAPLDSRWTRLAVARAPPRPLPAFLCSGAGVLAAPRPRCAAHPAGGGPGERRGVGARPRSGAEARGTRCASLRSPGAGRPGAESGRVYWAQAPAEMGLGTAQPRVAQPGADFTTRHR